MNTEIPAAPPRVNPIATDTVVTSYYPLVFTDNGHVLRVHYDGQITIDMAMVETYEVVGFLSNLAKTMTQAAIARDLAIAALIKSHELQPKGSLL